VYSEVKEHLSGPDEGTPDSVCAPQIRTHRLCNVRETEPCCIWLYMCSLLSNLLTQLQNMRDIRVRGQCFYQCAPVIGPRSAKCLNSKMVKHCALTRGSFGSHGHRIDFCEGAVLVPVCYKSILHFADLQLDTSVL
jgi:hypothetical protein